MGMKTETHSASTWQFDSARFRDLSWWHWLITLGLLAQSPDRRALWRVSKELVEEVIRRRIGSSEDEEERRTTRRGKSDGVEASGE